MDRFYSEEQNLLRANVRRFAETTILPAAADIDRTDRFPRDIYRGLAALGLFGVCLPAESGGSGMDSASSCIAMEEIARCSGSVGNAYALPVEAAMFFNQHGNDEQKKLIPGILDGSLLPATAVTEPDHGSDVAGMKTTAIRDGDFYVINGTKAWVTFGAIADFIVVFAKSSKDAGHRNISCYLVDGKTPGITRGKPEHLLGDVPGSVEFVK